MAHNNWQADLAHGQLGEAFVSQLGTDVSIEVKNCRKWHQTGNVFFELECNGKPSGIVSTKALYLVYLLHKDGRQVGGYILELKPLKKAIQSPLNDGLAIEKNYSGDGGRVKGIVVALDNMGELIKRMGSI